MRIYVGNLNYDTSEEEIQSLFSEYGDVDEVAVITDRETGRSRGFAFVTMPASREAEAAIEALNGHQLDGRSLTVNEARPKRSDGGGGGGGGGGRQRRDVW